MITEIPKNMLVILKQLESYQLYLLKLKKGLGDKSQIPAIENKIKELNLKLKQLNSKLTYLVSPKPISKPLIKPQLEIPKPQLEIPKIPLPQKIQEPPKETLQLVVQEKIILPKSFESETFQNLNKKQKKKILSDLKLTQYDIKEYIKRSEKERKAHFEKKEDYTIYKPNPYGEFANKYMKKHSLNLLAKYPKLFGPLFQHINKVNINMLSTTYVSLMLIFTLIAFPSLLIVFSVLNFSFKLNFLIITLISIVSTVLTFFGFYFYPGSLITQRSRNIKNELPFALVHMAAVAGSGANPISMFELIADSEEYKELKKETKKILNYVNLFGYNLSGALKRASQTTPSKELKEVFEGIITTVDTGGSLKNYLNEKSKDALRDYQQRKKKQVEALATFSDVYTAILIAAPLLLIVTLAIINSIGGQLGGFDAKTLSILGIYGLIPLMNLGFMGFLKVSQPDL